jgi:hypothetical protein
MKGKIMIIQLPNTMENEALVRKLLVGYFAFDANDDGEPVATIEQRDGMLVVDANEGAYPHREIQCLYRDLAFSSLPPDSWEAKYPEYIGTWDERGVIR